MGFLDDPHRFGESSTGVESEELVDKAFDPARNGPVVDSDPGVLLSHHSIVDLGRGVPFVGEFPGEEFVENDAEGVEVRPRVELLTQELFGRAVLEGPDVTIVSSHPGLGFEVLGDSEVDDLDPSVSIEHQVFGLDVPVEDPSLVDGCERVGDVPHHAERGPRGKGALGVHHFQEVLAVNELPGDEAKRSVLAGAEHLRDIGVVESSEGSCFGHQATESFGDVARRGADHLQGDLTLEFEVVGEVHDPHPSAADFTVDGVLPNASRLYGELGHPIGPRVVRSGAGSLPETVAQGRDRGRRFVGSFSKLRSVPRSFRRDRASLGSESGSVTRALFKSRPLEDPPLDFVNAREGGGKKIAKVTGRLA